MEKYWITYQHFPVICTCGRPLGHLKETFKDFVAAFAGEPDYVGKALNEIGLQRICCRMNMMNPAIIQLVRKDYIPSSAESFQHLNVSTTSASKQPSKSNSLQPSPTDVLDDIQIADVMTGSVRMPDTKHVGLGIMVPIVIGRVYPAI